MSTKKPVQWVLSGQRVYRFVEIEPSGVMWVHFSCQRMAYSTMQGKLKQVVHSVMVQFNLVSAWRN